MKHFSVSNLSRSMSRRLSPSKIGLYKTRFGLAAFLLVCSLLLILPTAFLSGGAVQGQKGDPVKVPELHSKLVPYSSQAVNFAETPTLGSVQPVPLSPEQMEKFRITQEQKQKNPSNSKRVKEVNNSLKGAFID